MRIVMETLFVWLVEFDEFLCWGNFNFGDSYLEWRHFLFELKMRIVIETLFVWLVELDELLCRGISILETSNWMGSENFK